MTTVRVITHCHHTTIMHGDGKLLKPVDLDGPLIRIGIFNSAWLRLL